MWSCIWLRQWTWSRGRLETIGAVKAHLGTDYADLVFLITAPTALWGRILLTRRFVLDRDPFCRHRFESLPLGKFSHFPIPGYRLLARR